MQQDNKLYSILMRQKQAYAAHPMPTAQERLNTLDVLRKMLVCEKNNLAKAIASDYGYRSKDEIFLAELIPSLQGIDYAMRSLKKWMRPSHRKVGLMYLPSQAQVVYQPLGVVGIVVPWNYPLFLSIGPLIGALAAGNSIMLKMSEYAPATATLLQMLLAQIYQQEQVAVITGDASVAAEFSQLPFDHLLFTGSQPIGKEVMQAASANLTPVTLELGGKSPALVTDNFPLKEAARRIAFGKAMNSGQTCVAPDYVLLPQHLLDDFIQAYSQAMAQFFPDNRPNPDFTRIINNRQYERLQNYLEDAQGKGATIIPLFKTKDDPQNEAKQRRMPHHLLYNVSDEMLIMQEEIFGPLLPLVPYQTLEDALGYINAHPRPLALYYFDLDKKRQQYAMTHTHSGGMCINDTLLHVAQEGLPFGGIGASGMGQYHGYEGFLTFSKAKGVYRKNCFNPAQIAYPPYDSTPENKWRKWFYRFFLK